MTQKSSALGLPQGAALSIFVVGRTVGWIAHAIEQYQSQIGQLNYREGFLGLAAYRSLFCPASTHAEAFLVCQPHEVGGLL